MTYRCPLCKHTFEADAPPAKHDYCGYRGKFDEPTPATQSSPDPAHSVRVSDAVLELAS